MPFKTLYAICDTYKSFSLLQPPVLLYYLMLTENCTYFLSHSRSIWGELYSIGEYVTANCVYPAEYDPWTNTEDSVHPLDGRNPLHAKISDGNTRRLQHTFSDPNGVWNSGFNSCLQYSASKIEILSFKALTI
jgi:hypothetical protein